jgi:hypothetical protein
VVMSVATGTGLSLLQIETIDAIVGTF